MVPVNYSYVYFSAGKHQRQPRTSSSGFATLTTLPPGSLTAGDLVPPVAAPETWTDANGAEYTFSFWNVSGGSAVAGGPPVSQQSYVNDSPAGVIVGNLPITALAIYVPNGSGPGGPDWGATIDQLDVTTNSLIDDTFVSVAPDPSGTLTQQGNAEGYVDTTSSTETITALPATTPSDVDFAGWVSLGPPATFSAFAAFVAAERTSPLALALYEAPPANLGAIALTVTYDSDGGIYPLGATVTSNPAGTIQVGSDAGTYLIFNLPAGPVQVRASLSLIERRYFAPAFEETTVTVTAGQTTPLQFQFVRRGTTL